jgi:3-oxoadipate enol-lactonase
VPTLVVAGRHDAVITSEETRALADAIPGARLEQMECGHLANLEEPQVFTEHLQAFLAVTA